MKKAFSILSWLMLIAVIILLMAFSAKKQKAADCKVFEVVVAQSENHFVNEKIAPFSVKFTYPLITKVRAVNESESGILLPPSSI